jgi:hypothetical protein
MLAPSPPPPQLPSPPTTHAEPAQPFKLRLRARGPSAPAPRKITKRAPPRGINKRRRALADVDGLDEAALDEAGRPSTPKRLRVAPEVLPLGLERADFLALQRAGETNPEPEPAEAQREAEEADGGGEEWTTEEDRILVELVLEKLKLTKSDWQDCARSLGKDRGSVGRRWKSLMGAGEVGLKGARRFRRAKIHATWR